MRYYRATRPPQGELGGHARSDAPRVPPRVARSPSLVLSADELIDAIRLATLRGIYNVKTWRIESLSLHAAMAFGRVRYSIGKVGFTDEARVWLASERDGQIWRMRIFNERKSSIDCLRRDDLALGV